MNDSVGFETSQSAVDAWYETFVRSEQQGKITPPLLLELSPPRIRFHSEDRPYLEELWAS